MNAALLARRIVVLLESQRIDVSTEDAAHRSIRRALEGADMPVRSEVRLTDKDRIDLLVETVGIEVKLHQPRRSILRQLERYAESDQIDVLVLATAAAFPRRPFPKVKDKPLLMASLVRGWL